MKYLQRNEKVAEDRESWAKCTSAQKQTFKKIYHKECNNLPVGLTDSGFPFLSTATNEQVASNPMPFTDVGSTPLITFWKIQIQK